MAEKYDAVIIGAGPAGGAAASVLLKAGYELALVENYGFGGTCPLRGCEPKKILVESAYARLRAMHSQGLGVKGVPQIDWAELAAFRDANVDPVSDKVESYWDYQGAHTYFGSARFVAPDAVEVNGEVLQAGQFLIASGARSRNLDVPGQELAQDSDDFLKLKELPKEIIFLGGGIIVMEFAQVAAIAGAKVRIIHRSERILRGFDLGLSQKLMEACNDLGIEIILNCPVARLERNNGRVVVWAGDDDLKAYEADQVFQAIGRVPDIDDLGLDAAEVSYSSKGVEVDRYMQNPGNPKVYAAGDAAASPFKLTPVADMEGRAAARNMLNPGSAAPNHLGVPGAVFTHPPLAGVGLNQREADEKGLKYQLLEGDAADWSEHERVGLKHAGFKVLVDQDSGLILGAHILGHRADEVINLFGLAMRQNITARELKETLWAYPTMGYTLKYILKKLKN